MGERVVVDLGPLDQEPLRDRDIEVIERVVDRRADEAGRGLEPEHPAEHRTHAEDTLHLGRDEVEPARDQGAEVVGHDLGDRGVRLELELTEHLTEAQRIAGADLLELTEGAVELVAPRRRRRGVDQRGELVAVHAAQLDLDVGS